MTHRKTVCIVTGSRSEYGLLKPLIEKFFTDDVFELRLVVTGSHLSEAFGETCQEIESDGISIHAKIELPLDSDTHSAMARATGAALISFAEYFENNPPDLLVVLGDRFEMLAVAIAASMQQIPIAHIAGGDTSEGAVDEFIRHSITKMSYLHFTTNDESKNRVIQLGEAPDRVFNVGSLGVDNIMSGTLMSLEELSKNLRFDLSGEYALVTYHPSTLNDDIDSSELSELLSALTQFPNLKYLFTYANADAGGRSINKMIDSYVKENSNSVAYASLGNIRYLSAMKYAVLVIGNSSSGLYETPSFGVPCINVGGRQKGRLRAENVIDTKPEAEVIKNAIRLALSYHFKEIARNTKSPFGDGKASDMIYRTIVQHLDDGIIDLKKAFYVL